MQSFNPAPTAITRIVKKIRDLGGAGVSIATYGDAAHMKNDSTFRVDFAKPQAIHVMCFGMEPVEPGVEGVYASQEELPEWLSEKLAVLAILPSPPPLSDVPGLGRRLSDTVFWVYA